LTNKIIDALVKFLTFVIFTSFQYTQLTPSSSFYMSMRETFHFSCFRPREKVTYW